MPYNSIVYGTHPYLSIQSVPPKRKYNQITFYGGSGNETTFSYGVNSEYTGLQQMIIELDLLCGVGNYEISINSSESKMYLTTHLSQNGQVSALNTIISTYLPNNLTIEALNQLSSEANGNIKQSGIVASGYFYTISE